MRRIFTLGETVLDIIFRDGEPVAAKAGGSMLNASVTLGRLGLPVYFISEFGQDEVGSIVDTFLQRNGVDTSFCNRYSDGKSAISLAFLDQEQNASYSFYKQYPQERLKIRLPEFTEHDILMFGSYFGIAPEIREKVHQILELASKAGSLIFYDPNFRKAHLEHKDQLMPFIRENFEYATLIKGSDEDFSNIFNESGILEVSKHLPAGKLILETLGKEGAEFNFGNINFRIPAKELKPVSTVGAGDNFNAGLIFGVFSRNINLNNIPTFAEKDWKDILQTGIDFASEVCLSIDNYVSSDFAIDYLKDKRV